MLVPSGSRRRQQKKRLPCCQSRVQWRYLVEKPGTRLVPREEKRWFATDRWGDHVDRMRLGREKYKHISRQTNQEHSNKEHAAQELSWDDAGTCQLTQPDPTYPDPFRYWGIPYPCSGLPITYQCRRLCWRSHGGIDGQQVYGIEEKIVNFVAGPLIKNEAFSWNQVSADVRTPEPIIAGLRGVVPLVERQQKNRLWYRKPGIQWNRMVEKAG